MPEVQASETAVEKSKIELANKLQGQITNNTAQILCGNYLDRRSYPFQIVIASDGVYKLNTTSGLEPKAEKILNASDIYRTSQDKLVAAKIIRNQECGLTF